MSKSKGRLIRANRITFATTDGKTCRLSLSAPQLVRTSGKALTGVLAGDGANSEARRLGAQVDANGEIPCSYEERALPRMRDAYHTLMRGDSLTDDEVDLLVKHFGEVVELLSPLGDVFHLARKEAIERYNQCYGYKLARESGQ